MTDAAWDALRSDINEAFIDGEWRSRSGDSPDDFIARHRPIIEAALTREWTYVERIVAETRASLLAELRAQAYGSPRAVPLRIIERILASEDRT